jgi:hypothetical protein
MKGFKLEDGEKVDGRIAMNEQKTAIELQIQKTKSK